MLHGDVLFLPQMFFKEKSNIKMIIYCDSLYFLPCIYMAFCELEYPPLTIAGLGMAGWSLPVVYTPSFQCDEPQ